MSDNWCRMQVFPSCAAAGCCDRPPVARLIARGTAAANRDAQTAPGRAAQSITVDPALATADGAVARHAERLDDFIRNFLTQRGMIKALDAFQVCGCIRPPAG